MDILSKIMEGIRALRERLASLKREHREAIVEIVSLESSVKDLETSAEGTRSVIERDRKAVEDEKDQAAKPILEQTLADHEGNLRALEEELASRKSKLDGLKASEAERQAARLNGREELSVERDKARKAANRAISAATTAEEIDIIEGFLGSLSLPRNRCRVKRRWL